MNRRAFLLGSAAALVVKAHPLGGTEAVEVAPTIDVHLWVEDHMTARLLAAKRLMEDQIYQAFFYGDSGGHPSGILAATNAVTERAKPVVDAVAAMHDAGDADMRGYEFLFTSTEPDPSVLTLESLKEAMAKLDSPNPRRGKSVAGWWATEFGKMPAEST